MKKYFKIAISIFSLFIQFFLLIGCNVNVIDESPPLDQSTVDVEKVIAQDITVLPKENRPNLILILVDDLDLLLKTIEYMPNFQRNFVEEGTTILDFVVNIPVCCPSRATILTGQYPHNHQTYINDPPDGGFEKFYSSDAENSTIATWLYSAGYQTVLLGKYLNGYPLRTDRAYIPPGWSEWYSPAKGKPYVGFNYTMNENGELVDYGENTEDYLTDILGEKAIDFISRSEDNPAPFFMFLSTYAPHEPAQPAPRHLGIYQELTAPQTPSFNEEDVSDKPEWIQTDPQLSEGDIAVINETYRYRVESMQAVDEMIDELIDVLISTDQLSNTYIIFTSDNGYHLGQHRQISGKSSAYEEDVRVPFVIRGPEIPGGKIITKTIGTTIDIAPTLADLAGIIPPDFVDGRSLMPLFGNSSIADLTWREMAVIEFYGISNVETGQIRDHPIGNYHEEVGLLEPRDLDQMLLDTPSPIYVAIRTSTFKYIEYHDGEREYYDLTVDPYELENILPTVDSAQISELSKWLDQFLKCSGEQCRTLENHLD